MTARDAATARQILAARPEESSWVSANAGSGKTKVLIDRVARLLLRGVPPQKILCLTYTKAAAAEMQNRLFARLGGWAMLADADLSVELGRLGDDARRDSTALRDARRLFARAIEAPGGLKIQTIHAFCASLLRRFPLEAGVPPDFAEIDDRAQRLMMEEVVEALAEGPEASLIEALAWHYTGEDFAGLTGEIAGNRARFGPIEGLDVWLGRFGLPAGTTEATILAQVFDGGERRYAEAILPHLDPASRNDKRPAAALAALGPLDQPVLGDLECFEEVGLTGASAAQPFSAKTAASGSPFPKKAIRGALGAALDGWDDFLQRVEEGGRLRRALGAAQRCHSLHAFAGPFLAGYESRKLARGLLDFDDLILRAGALLSRPGVAEWVLYRLDGGIDHILVDEAQDTSPEQWEVIRLIAEEFTTGRSARSDVPRTLFVVGDVKQSIYSFQGADPANFDRMAGHFGGRLSEVGQRLGQIELQHSFRSTPAILKLVDVAFSRPDRHSGLGGAPSHAAFHEDSPGRVDLWPVVVKTEALEDPPWYDPVDRIEPSHHDLTLARAIASEIARLCDPASGETLPVRAEDGTRQRRPLGPGDFLILVQRRSALFAEIIRACKAEGLPIAGADRLRLGAELAVKDLAALLAFLATPEDSLSLAAALRSPLFGWSEDQLYRLAAGRGKRYLWEVLRSRKEAESETLLMLDDLRREADFLRPFELIERILTRHGGRSRILARLGPEAEDGIDALLAQALAFERMEVPSLTGFLSWMETDDVEVKRRLETGGGVVRVMTVHGAKGLEAPVVILPDTRAPQGRDQSEIVLTPDSVPLLKTRAEDASPEIAEAVAARKARQEAERMRLLYVAMTRARSWLIVAGAGDVDRGTGSWHGIVADAMQAVGGLPQDFPTGPGLRFDTGAEWQIGEVVKPEKTPGPEAALPPWSRVRAPAPEPALEPLSPSDLGGAKALAGEAARLDEAAALRRGRQLHRLFEHLPDAAPADRPALARALLAAGEDAATPAEADEIFAEASRVLDDPAFAAIFGTGALAEVEIAALVAGLGGRSLRGAIDRLIVAPDEVLAVDFKSNAVLPLRAEDVPEGILRQMGAYAAALGQVYPGRRVVTAILWTSAPLLMPLPAHLIAAALDRVSVP